MKKAVAIAAITLLGSSASAQVFDNTIVKKPTWLGSMYLKDGNKLKFSELKHNLYTVPEAAEVYKKGLPSYYTGQVLGAAGGLLVGFTLGTAVAGGDADWTAAAVGAGLIGLSIPFTVGYIRKTDEAVAIYNARHLPPSGRAPAPEFSLSLSATGAGLRLQF